MIDFTQKVLTPDGERPVNEIREGDVIFSTTNRKVLKNTVKKVIESRAGTLVRVHCNGSGIACEPEQYLASRSRTRSQITYTKASRVSPGLMVYRSEEGLTAPEEVTVVDITTTETVPVVGFKLADYPFNYIAEGFVVGSE